jgi:excisionase family DNA binding protein
MATERIELLTVPEVATELRVHRATVYEIFRRKEMLRTKVGKRSLVKRAELNRYVERNTERPTVHSSG